MLADRLKTLGGCLRFFLVFIWGLSPCERVFAYARKSSQYRVFTVIILDISLCEFTAIRRIYRLGVKRPQVQVLSLGPCKAVLSRERTAFFCNLFDVFKILQTALKSKPKQNGCLSRYREASVLQFQLFNGKLWPQHTANHEATITRIFPPFSAVLLAYTRKLV